MTDTPACRVCGNTANNQVHLAREMMYGSGETFDYLECGSCGCVHLVDIPEDLGQYYPAEYCAYGNPTEKFDPHWIAKLRAARTRYYLGKGDNLLAKVAGKLARRTYYFDWMAGMDIDLDSRILDVGCGTGRFLVRLARDGFTSLEGLEPFIDEDLHYKSGVHIRKRSVPEMEGEYDLIMLHHSFEHMPDPKDVLPVLRDHLSDKGYILIRIPLAGMWAWRKFGTNWVNLDAPRHVFLHTPRSLHVLAAEAGLTIGRTVYDSNFKQLAVSQMIERDVTMVEYERGAKNVYTEEDITRFEAFAQELNAHHDGDMACFVLQKA